MSSLAVPRASIGARVARGAKVIDINMQRKPDYWILASVIGLCLIGLIMVYSSSYADMLGGSNPDPSGLARQQLQNMLLGFVLLIGFTLIPYNSWRRLSVPMMAFVLVGLILVLIAPSPIADTINGAKRWIHYPFQWQPSELCKLILTLYIADWLSQKGKKIRNLTYGLIPFGIVMGVIAALVMKEPDMGTTMVLCCIGVVMFFVAGAHMVQFLGSIGLAGFVFYLLMHAASYRTDRMVAWTDPWSDPLGVGWHSTQSLMAIGSGGILGQGLGAGRQKFGWLPEQYTDTIFAVLGQEWGFIGALLLIGLFVLLMVRGVRIALKAPDAYGMLIATGVTTWLGFQALINIGAVSGAIPFTGVTLPFISLGGSSMLVTLAAVGLLLNVSRYSRTGAMEALNSETARAEPKPKRSLKNLRRDASANLRQALPKRRIRFMPTGVRAASVVDNVKNTTAVAWQRQQPTRSGAASVLDTVEETTFAPAPRQQPTRKYATPRQHTPVTAESIAASWSREQSSAVSSEFDQIAQWRRPDERTGVATSWPSAPSAYEAPTDVWQQQQRASEDTAGDWWDNSR